MKFLPAEVGKKHPFLKLLLIKLTFNTTPRTPNRLGFRGTPATQATIGCANRRLMPAECWRLQGYEKAQFEKVAATGMSDAQLYKQAGNSITVNVVVEIARNLLKFDKEMDEYGK